MILSQIKELPVYKRRKVSFIDEKCHLMVQWFIRGVLITARDVIVCYGRRRLLLNADLNPTVNICQREEFEALLGGFFNTKYLGLHEIIVWKKFQVLFCHLQRYADMKINFIFLMGNLIKAGMVIIDFIHH